MLLKKNIPWTYILGKIKFDLIVIGAYAAAFGLWHQDLNLHHITIPLAIPAIIGTVISLLLAFRSNQAYDRWWEARIIWGSIVNDSRTLIRQAQSFISDPDVSIDVREFIERFTQRQIYWTHSLGRMLRRQDALSQSDGYLNRSEAELVRHRRHIPNTLLQLHARDLKHAFDQGWINAYQQVEIDKTLTRLCDAMGKCERIKNTVFPTTYSLYIHFALYLFILMLPFGLTEHLGGILVPVIILISACFLFIEKMAIHLQDPFENKPTDTPMTTIARNIEYDLNEMIDERLDYASNASKVEVDEKYYYVL
ncbi:bestrophin family ion channel [Chryseolinea sp. T2]|uniref:bestrophin family protein n=1 Tax=Chryseolinea sp. T2 TaxID=3129255 RepID=UPI0030783A69